MATQLPSSSSSTHGDHDVFLSFRGEDTRKNFTDHLYKALVQVGICTFRDNEELRRGKNISNELRKAIRGSRISIVVFSKHYASSTWCLDELAEIVECCRKNISHTLLPIFYHVDPSDVRKQSGTFAKAFVRLEKRFQTNIAKVKRWREALTEAGSLSGWDLSSVADGYEGKFIEKIVGQVLHELNPVDFQVAEHPIEINSRAEVVKALLKLETNDVRIVGIYGIGGIGKTTIAKAVYNQICFKFEGSSCLLNIKEISKEANGLVRLQTQLLYDILKKDFRIDHVDKGVKLIKKMLSRKEILIVFDDVDDLDQLQRLLGDLKWFFLGSKVIMTTRNEHLLTQLKAHGRYKVSPLDDSQSLELFSWHAFEMTHPRQGFEELSISAVNYVEGLPLALKVLGSFLKDRKYVEWKSELEKLRGKPHNKIQKVLRMSFDSLEDSYMQDTFLDIACFFVGMEKYHAMKILEDCGLFPDIGMTILEQRSLLMIDHNKLWMHSLIQDMGREIVREKANYVLENYSRLWFYKDALDVISKDMVRSLYIHFFQGSQHVKGFSLNSPVLEDVHLKTKEFRNMKNLRLLQINAIHLKGSYKQFSSELRWLCWHKCPLKFLPKDFHLENLVVLDLQQSKIVQVWKGYKILNKLKVLNLQNSTDLIKSPNFSGFPHLEVLILEGCTNLVEVHGSIGCLKELIELNLRGCISLTNLPNNILNIESLQTLDLSYCLKLFESSKQVGSTMALTKVHRNGTTTELRLSNFGLWKNLKIELFGREQKSSNSWFSWLSHWISHRSSIHISSLLPSISQFHSLVKLHLSYCGLSEDNFPIDLASLSSLLNLDLSGNNFRTTPHGISRLSKLSALYLDDCMALQSISELPASIWDITAKGSTSLGKFSSSLDMEHSPIFYEYESHDQVNLLRLISLPLTFVLLSENSIQQLSGEGVQFPIVFLQNIEAPDWFSHQAIGPFISFQVPPLSEGLIYEILVCACYRPVPYASNCTSIDGPIVAISFYNKTRGYNQSLHTKVPLHFVATYRHIYRIPLWFFACSQCYVLQPCFHFPSDSHLIYIVRQPSKFRLASGDEIEVSIKFHGDFEVHKCGIHLLTRPFPPWIPIIEDDFVTTIRCKCH